MSTFSDWTAGNLRQPFLGYLEGQVVFVRASKTKTPLSVGPTYWLKPQGTDCFHLVAESYGGRSLYQLFSPTRKHGKLLITPEATSSLLTRKLRSWLDSAPPGAKRWPEKRLSSKTRRSVPASF